MNKQRKKVLSIFIKISIVALCLWFVHSKLKNNDDLREFIYLINRMTALEISLLLGLLLGLMLVNWLVEAIKWKMLIAKVERLSLWRSVESVFCGLSLAIFTPNRIGEYGGRVFFLSPKRRIIGVFSMAVGNIAQLVIKNVLGAFSICLFVYRFANLDPTLFIALCGVAAVFAMFFIVFYFNIQWINVLLLSNKFTRKYKKFYQILGRYSNRELLKIMSLSILRFWIFSGQYFIVFLWLIPDLKLLDVFMLVNILFFVQSFLPSLDLLDIGPKAITAMYFFGFITTQTTAVVACIASIWLINIIIPAILGSYFVFKLKLFGNSSN